MSWVQDLSGYKWGKWTVGGKGAGKRAGNPAEMTPLVQGKRKVVAAEVGEGAGVCLEGKASRICWVGRGRCWSGWVDAGTIVC